MVFLHVLNANFKILFCNISTLFIMDSHSLFLFQELKYDFKIQ